MKNLKSIRYGGGKNIEIWDDITEEHIFFELFEKCMCIAIEGVSEIDLFLYSVSLYLLLCWEIIKHVTLHKNKPLCKTHT